jgi:hypothetical protein
LKDNVGEINIPTPTTNRILEVRWGETQGELPIQLN